MHSVVNTNDDLGSFTDMFISANEVVLENVQDLKEGWEHEFERLNFDLGRKIDASRDLAELITLPCSYFSQHSPIKTYQNNLRCPIGHSFSFGMDTRFMFMSPKTLDKQDIPDSLRELKSKIDEKLNEFTFGPAKIDYSGHGHPDIGYVICSIVYELTRGELTPDKKNIADTPRYKSDEWGIVLQNIKNLFNRNTKKQELKNLYSFLWRNEDLFYLSDPVSSSAALALRLGLRVTKIADKAIVWIDEESSKKGDIPLGILLERNPKFYVQSRMLRVTWLHHTDRGEKMGMEL